MQRIALILLLSITIAACSSRVVYEPQSISTMAPAAININTATVDELEKLPHIGRKTAGAIVDHRERHGGYRRVEHLMLIRGVSETRFAEIRSLLRAE